MFRCLGGLPPLSQASTPVPSRQAGRLAIRVRIGRCFPLAPMQVRCCASGAVGQETKKSLELTPGGNPILGIGREVALRTLCRFPRQQSNLTSEAGCVANPPVATGGTHHHSAVDKVGGCHAVGMNQCGDSQQQSSYQLLHLSLLLSTHCKKRVKRLPCLLLLPPPTLDQYVWLPGWPGQVSALSKPVHRQLYPAV